MKSIKFPFICNRLSCKWLPLFSCWLITYSDDSYSFIYLLQFPIRKVDIFNPQNSEILYDWLAIVVCQSQSIVMFFKSSKCLKKMQVTILIRIKKNSLIVIKNHIWPICDCSITRDGITLNIWTQSKLCFIYRYLALVWVSISLIDSITAILQI